MSERIKWLSSDDSEFLQDLAHHEGVGPLKALLEKLARDAESRVFGLPSGTPDATVVAMKNEAIGARKVAAEASRFLEALRGGRTSNVAVIGRKTNARS